MCVIRYQFVEKITEREKNGELTVVENQLIDINIERLSKKRQSRENFRQWMASMEILLTALANK